MHNLRPLNSPTYYLFIISSINPSPTLHIPGGTGKRRLGIGGHALMSECPGHWTIQRELKSALKCTVWITTHVHPRRTDKQTNRRKNVVVIARRLVMWTHRAPITRSSANAEEPCEHTVSWDSVKCCTNVRRIALEKACKRWMTFKVIQGHCRCCHLIGHILFPMNLPL